MSSSLHYSGVASWDSFVRAEHVVVWRADDVCWYVFWNSLSRGLPLPRASKARGPFSNPNPGLLLRHLQYPTSRLWFENGTKIIIADSLNFSLKPTPY
jgi:hypothetical protein